jgi:hypothetical protein
MFAHQKGTSFFRLYNSNWQCLGLDTAYLNNDLNPEQLPALNEWVGLSGAGGEDHAPPQRTILLSHHQLGSARAQRSVGAGIRTKTDAARKHGRIHAWFWGHEHRCFVYDEYLGVKCPVCIGNGGVPELLSGAITLSRVFQAMANGLGRALAFARHPFVRAPRVAYEPQPYVDEEQLEWEPLGFVVIELDGPNGKAVYVDETGSEEVIESFGG